MTSDYGRSVAIRERTIDSETVDESGRRWPAALAALVVGMLLGVLAGSLFGASRPATYESSTALSVLPDPVLDITSTTDDQGGVASLDATAYIQSQLVILNGAQLSDRVQSELALATRPDVTSTQVGQTYVVEVQASDSSAAGANAIAAAVGRQYRAIRIQELTSEINGLLVSTGEELKSVSGGLTSQRATTNSSAPLTPSQTALQTEYERLLAVRSSLTSTLAQVGGVVTVVSPARVATASASTTEKDALAGLVVGALVGLVVFFTVRRSLHRIRSVADLAALDIPVLLPVQSRRPLRSVHSPTFWRSSRSRLLAARIAAEARADGNAAMLFVGTTSRVGTSTTAASVAAALAESAPVLLIQTGSGSERPHADPVVALQVSRLRSRPLPSSSVVQSSMPGVWLLAAAVSGHFSVTRRGELIGLIDRASSSGWTVVIDAAPMSESDAAVTFSRAGSTVVLVVGRGRSAPSDVLAAAELFEAQGVTMAGAVLNDAAGRLRSLLIRWRPSMAPGVSLTIERSADLASVDAPPSPGYGSAPSATTIDLAADEPDSDDVAQQADVRDAPTATEVDSQPEAPAAGEAGQEPEQHSDDETLPTRQATTAESGGQHRSSGSDVHPEDADLPADSEDGVERHGPNEFVHNGAEASYSRGTSGASSGRRFASRWRR